MNDFDDNNWMNDELMTDDIQQRIYPVPLTTCLISNLKASVHVARMPS